jgi:hypothetical protein
MDDADDTFLQGLSRDRHADLAGRDHGPWARRAGVGVLLAAALVALGNGFGQASSTSSAVAPAATLKVRTPARIRGGLLYQSRFDVVAHRALTQPKLVLGTGWNDGLTINTIEPSPAGEASRNGRLVLTFDSMQPGDSLTLWVDYQVNPTHVGRTTQDVELDDGDTVLARLHRTLTVFP